MDTSRVPKKSLSKKSTSKLSERRATIDSSKNHQSGTLKRKRWIMKTLKEKSQGYEDDIFEAKKIPNPITIPDDASDASDDSIESPILGFPLTPNVKSQSPLFKPCISSNDLTAARRIAEEYQFSRKTWKREGKTEFENKTVALENQVSEKSAMANVLEAHAYLENFNQEESEEEDDNFSDTS